MLLGFSNDVVALAPMSDTQILQRTLGGFDTHLTTF